MTNPTAAHISDDAIEIAGAYYPGLFTYHPHNRGRFAIEIVPLTDDPRLTDLRIIIGSTDLQELHAMHNQHTEPTTKPLEVHDEHV